jgi:membrane-bound serine protease (ClpP class)
MRALVTNFMAALLAVCTLALAIAGAHAQPKVYVIDVHGPVWPGQATFVEDKLDEAERNGASAVILDIDTFGGLAQSAVDMKDAILSHNRDYVTVGFVHNRALSSGSLVTLACKFIAMAPGADLGSAQPHPAGGGDPDPETLSWDRTEFSSTAEARGRNPVIASAWVTSPVAIPSLSIKEGDILTLSTDQAKENGYCDVVAADVPDILAFLKLPGAEITTYNLDFLQSSALAISNPWVTTLLLAIGTALIVWEMLTLHSWGLAGIIGGVVVGLVFVAHVIAGTAGWIGMVLFVAGVGLVLFEMHVLPTHGVLLLSGSIVAAIGLFYALGGDKQNAMYPASVSVILVAILIVGFLFYLPKSRFFKVFGQPGRQRAAAGYVSSSDYTGFLGSVGRSVTPLRPAGIADIDGTRLDVVTAGSFLPPDTDIEVYRVEGSKVVVRVLEDTNKA